MDRAFRGEVTKNSFASYDCIVNRQSHTEYRHALQSQRDTLRDRCRNEGADVDGTARSFAFQKRKIVSRYGRGRDTTPTGNAVLSTAFLRTAF